ncbi:MAG TPA: AMP-binding protein, partial [Thermoanaerobaculia bacterium]
MSLLSRLEEIAREDPRRAAVAAGDERLTYGELLARIGRRAGKLQGPGLSLVVLDGARPIDFLVDFFAARGLGRTVLSHPPQLPASLRALREAAVAAALAADSGGSASRDAAAIFYSSGSVGPAKAVPLSDASLEAAATALAEWGEVRAGDRLAIGLSPAQILGFVRGALNALLFGAEAVFYRPLRDPLAEAERLGADA